jgi:hypothetical protein
VKSEDDNKVNDKTPGTREYEYQTQMLFRTSLWTRNKNKTEAVLGRKHWTYLAGGLKETS